MIKNDATEMAKRLLVDSIWKSANLEGLGTSFPKTEMILENIPVDTSKEEVLFIVNMKRVWEFLLENIDYRNCFQFIRELNKIVGDNLFYGAGEVRTLEVSIGGTTWKPAMPNDLEIIHSIEKIEDIEDVELRALSYFCFIARSQIFIDGNKRVAQLMTNKVLIENNIGIFQIPMKGINRFKTLLLRFYESNNSDELMSFMNKYCINRIRGSVVNYQEEVSSDNVTFIKSEEKGEFILSSNQVSILNRVLFNLRNLLVSEGKKGIWDLREDKGEIILESSAVDKFMLNGNDAYSKGAWKDSLKVKEFIIGTIKLLNERVPLAVKSLSFSLDTDILTYGEFYKSDKEKGSVNIILR